MTSYTASKITNSNKNCDQPPVD